MGSMGHGIAQLSAEAGFKVVATDASAEGLAHGMRAIESSLKLVAARKVKKGTATEAEAEEAMASALSLISATDDMGEVASSTDLVIEAIIEDRGIKLKFFEDLGKLVTEDTIVATNTSSYSVKEMAVASGIPERVCGLHYFNPVQIMKLCEVIGTDLTDPAVLEKVNTFVAKQGKTAVTCGDTPGFIVNRLLVPYIAQGVGLLARGDATAKDIDTAMMLGAGHPMGPITLSDYVGNDINLAVMKGWMEKEPENPAFQNPEGVALLEQMVADGLLGRKTGQGFYKWDGNKCLGE